MKAYTIQIISSTFILGGINDDPSVKTAILGTGQIGSGGIEVGCGVDIIKKDVGRGCLWNVRSVCVGVTLATL